MGLKLSVPATGKSVSLVKNEALLLKAAGASRAYFPLQLKSTCGLCPNSYETLQLLYYKKQGIRWCSALQLGKTCMSVPMEST